MLSETDNILDKTYLTKGEAVELFRNYIHEHIKRYKYDDITNYLKDVCFLQLQPAGKSQNIIVEMIVDIIHTDYGLDIADYETYPKKLYIYFDDVLVTGGTILNDLSSWINENNRVKDLNDKHIILEIDLIVEHRLGLNMMLYQLEKIKCPGLNMSNINIWHYYEVENHYCM